VDWWNEDEVAALVNAQIRKGGKRKEEEEE
jgi:hypothetical protein